MKAYLVAGKGWPSGTVLPKDEDCYLTYTARITNSLSDIPRSNEPARIAVNFSRGVVKDLSKITVLNAEGVQVAWQWEPTRHARTDVDISRWPDGSHKSGYVWVVVPAIAAGGSATYTITVNRTGSKTFPAVVTFSEPSAAEKRIDTTGYQYKFTSAWTFGLKNLIQKSNSKDFFVGSSSGVDTAYKHTNAGTANYSGNSNGTGAPLTSLISAGLVDSDSFGYGCVFVDYETVYTPQVESRIQQRQKYRVFADGSCELLVRHIATESVPTTDLKIQFSTIRLDGTGLSATASVPKLQVNGNYAASGALQVMCRSTIQASDIEGAIRWDFFPATAWAETTIPRIRMGGQRANYAIPAGAERRYYYTITPRAVADFGNNELRSWNPLVASATRVPSVSEGLSRLRKEFAVYLEKYRAYSPANSQAEIQIQKAAALFTDSKVNGLGFDFSAVVSQAVADWLTYGRRGPADSGLGARQFAAWNAGVLNNLGWQFVGRDMHGFDMLATEANRLGLTSLRDELVNCISGIAEFARLCWVGNGSTGRIVLDRGNPENLNATAEAAMAIAYANKWGVATADQLTALNSIWAALLAGFQFRNWPPYTFASGSYISTAIFLQVLSYFHRVTLAIKIVPEMVTSLSTNINPMQCLLEGMNPQGQGDEFKWNYNRNRRGSPATYIHFAANMALYGGPSEIEQAIRIMRNVNEQAPAGLPSAYPMEGWLNPNSRGFGDPLCGMLMGLALNRLENT